MWKHLFVALVLSVSPSTGAQTTLLDAMDSTDGWETFAPEGVHVEIASDAGMEGESLRIDYTFERGGGFAIVRKSFDIEVDPNYKFEFHVRGDAPVNDLEFKLLDQSGDNVWWHNRRRFAPPNDWTKLVSARRNIEFAWGPTEDRTLRQVAEIEFAIASATGGSGTIYLDNLTYTPLAQPVALNNEVEIRTATEQRIRAEMPAAFGEAVVVGKGLEIDLRGSRELGGLVLGWVGLEDDFAYTIEGSTDGTTWESVRQGVRASTGSDVVTFVGEGYQRLRVTPTAGGSDVALGSLEFIPIAASESQNELVAHLASRGLRTHLPSPYHGRRVFWTIAGLPEGDTEALLNEHGAFEPVKAGPRLEPALLVDGQLLTGADASLLKQSLPEGWMPVPAASWVAEGLTVHSELVALADDVGFRTRYSVTNQSDVKRSGQLVLAVRPFQVLPHWQQLNVVGGTSPIHSIRLEEQEAFVNGERFFETDTPADVFVTTSFRSGEIMQRLAEAGSGGSLSPNSTDENALASGAWCYSFELEPGDSMSVIADHADGEIRETFEQSRMNALVAWDEVLGEFWLRLPPEQKHLEDSVRASIAYALVNRDGPAIQPGSRSYERTWIRDGSLTNHALLGAGLHDKAVEFVDWYSGYLFENGKAPCCVDHRGSDPVDEHDSTGQYIHAVWSCYQFTRDDSFLRSHYDAVVRSMAYIESLRAQRLGESYADEASDQHVFYGLVPESISHEGYSAKPMHSYWDDFFILLGISDAANIAGVLGEEEDQRAWNELEASFRETLHDSIELAMAQHSIDYIPGCAELGDFDATSTAIAGFPVHEMSELPDDAVRATFDRYWRMFVDRRDDRVEWLDYTPYEVRTIGTMADLGEPERAREMVEFFLDEQTPQGWRQWPEVVHRDVRGPGFIGDLPHSWVASDFVNSITSLLVQWDRDATELHIARALPTTWIDGDRGIQIHELSTPFGLVSWQAERQGNEVVFSITRCDTMPEGGIWIDFQPDPGGDAQSRHVTSLPARVVIPIESDQR